MAEMGTVGLGLDPWMLLQHGQVARGHLKRIEQEVSRLLSQSANVVCTYLAKGTVWLAYLPCSTSDQ